MFFRPRAQSAVGLKPIEPVNLDFTERLRDAAVEDSGPRVAVLDGLPVENHAALAGRVIVDDPDGHGTKYQPGQQQHGTAMASLLVHGDLNGNGPALRHKIYVRPIFHPDSFNLREITPPNRLLVDLIHRAVRRLYEGDGQQPPVAPTVRIVSLSLGNPEQPFDAEISALARLLDWLAWKYKILLIVSIGNRAVPLNLGVDNLEGLADEDVVSRVLQAMRREQVQKRPLSPAEAINCISVGGLHADECLGYDAGNRLDLLRGRKLPTPINTISSGFRRSTKPEILFPGGRLLYRQDPPNGGVRPYSAVESLRAPGIMTATPGQAPMELNRVRHSCGTSNAAALASRCAALAHERLTALTPPADCEPLNDTYYTVLLKALLVHGASWGEAANMIERAFPEAMDQWQKIGRLKQLFLGYGEVDITRCLGANEQRATLLGWGSISEGAGHVFKLPLPPSLSARTDLRRLTVTLAWLTPTNLQHRDYRRAQLWIDVPEEEIGTQREGLDAKSAQRGTVEHRTFRGTAATPFVDGTKLRVQINCKEDAGKLDVSVPYAIAVTLEVGPGVQIDIYQEINARVRQPVEIHAAG
jgi:Subtilase family